VAEHARKLVRQMQHGVVLNVRVMADNDAVDVAAQHRAIPHAGMRAERHVTDDHSGAGEINTPAELRPLAKKFIELRIQFAHAGNLRLNLCQHNLKAYSSHEGRNFSNWSNASTMLSSAHCMTKPASTRPVPPRRKLPRSFKDLTPAKHFNPRTFFQEMILKGWFTKRTGTYRPVIYSRLRHGQVAVTWIGHASFLIQFNDLNVLVDPNFANWLFLMKRLKRSGMHIRDLPPIDLVLLSHAHFDHFHKPTLRKLAHPKIGILPWGVGDLARDLGFGRIVEL